MMKLIPSKKAAGQLMLRTDLIDSDNIRCRRQNEIDTSEYRFGCFDPVIDLYPTCERVAKHGRIQGAAQMLPVFTSAIGPLIFAESPARLGTHGSVLPGFSVLVLIFGIAAYCINIRPFGSPIAP